MMMKLNRTSVITIFAFLFGGAAGAYLSYSATMDYAIDQSMLEIATSTQIEVNALRGLRENDREGAVKLLEAYIDVRIAELPSVGNYSDLTNNAVSRAIELTKSYRAQYPKNDAPDSKGENEKQDRSFPKP